MKIVNAIRVMTCLATLMGPLASTDASAQSAAALSRREELVKVRELINDPDPLMRLANFEALVEEGDATKLQIAIQTALTGDDPMLRSAGMKAYLSGNREFVATLSLESTLQQKLNKAMPEGYPAVEAVTKNYLNLDRFIQNTGMRGSFRIVQFDAKTSKGMMYVNWGNEGKTGSSMQLSGDRLVGTFGINSTVNTGGCHFEARPTRELILLGSFTCGGTGFGVVTIAAPMF